MRLADATKPPGLSGETWHDYSKLVEKQLPNVEGPITLKSVQRGFLNWNKGLRSMKTVHYSWIGMLSAESCNYNDFNWYRIIGRDREFNLRLLAKNLGVLPPFYWVLSSTRLCESVCVSCNRGVALWARHAVPCKVEATSRRFFSVTSAQNKSELILRCGHYYWQHSSIVVEYSSNAWNNRMLV